MRVILERSATKTFRRIPTYIQQKILVKIEALEKEPFPVGAIKLSERPGFRIRIGDYRVLYEVDKIAQIITVLAIAHRREIYRLNDAIKDKKTYTTAPQTKSTTEIMETAPQTS